MGQTLTLPVRGAFIYLQGANRLPIAGGQGELKPDGGVKVDEMMQANIPQVYGRSGISATRTL